MHRLLTCSAGKGCLIVNYKAFSSGKVSDRTNVSGFDRLSSAPFMLLALATGIWQQYAGTSISHEEIPHVIKGKERSISGSSGYQWISRGMCERQTSNHINPPTQHIPSTRIQPVKTLSFGSLMFALSVKMPLCCFEATSKL